LNLIPPDSPEKAAGQKTYEKQTAKKKIFRTQNSLILHELFNQDKDN